MKAIIFGKSGQLANELLATKPNSYSAKCFGRNDIDLLNVQNVEALLQTETPDVIINASAYTLVDKAETDTEAAYALNELAVKNLAVLSQKNNIRLIHVSTDFVFDGAKSQSYKPSDETNPKSIYGKSKLAGELAIQELHPDNSVIIRTSWVYSSFGNNFVKTMLKLMNDRDELGIVVDQIGCPTYAKELAYFIWALSEEADINAIYHWSDLGVTSWYDFACAIYEKGTKLGLITSSTSIKPIPSSSYPTPAERPKFSLLNTDDSQAIYLAKHWQIQLDKCLKELTST